jgi:hypothetical protein
VASSQILHEAMPGDHDPGAAVLLEPAQVLADRQHNHIGWEAEAGEDGPCCGSRTRAGSSHTHSLAARTQSPPMQQCLAAIGFVGDSGQGIIVGSDAPSKKRLAWTIEVQ